MFEYFSRLLAARWTHEILENVQRFIPRLMQNSQFHDLLKAVINAGKFTVFFSGNNVRTHGTFNKVFVNVNFFQLLLEILRPLFLREDLKEN